MVNEVVIPFIDGEPQQDLVPDLVEIEVEENTSASDVFRMRVALHSRCDGAWNYLDDDRFAVWRRFSLKAGYPGQVQMLIDGYITHVDVGIGQRGDSYLEVSGMDATAVMDLEEKQRAWPSRADHEIAQEIFSRSYELSHEVEDTRFRREETTSTTMQTETDIRFLRRLAYRNGFECFVRGGTGFFRSPDLQGAPQPPLAIEFGGRTTLNSLRVSLDGTAASLVEMRRLDPVAKSVEHRTRTGSPRRLLGRRSLAALRSNLPVGRAFLRRQAAASVSDMDGRLREAYEPASGFVTIEGEIDSRAYRNVLRARRLVTIKGAGSTFSGRYYVTRVRHTFTVDGYSQQFEASRNGIGVIGDEDFSEVSQPVPVPAGDRSERLAGGNRVLPATQRGVVLAGGD
jgi:phage protein D